MEFVSLKYDFAFKHVMQNETVRKHFISDALGLPVEEIKTVKLANTFLWKRYRRQKLGILDVLVELNDHSKVNIELQIKMVKHWHRRNLFYLTKMFCEDIRAGEKFERMKRCICISILDFNLDEDSEYHSVYRLRDKRGREFSDLLEIHIIELNKELYGEDPMNDWIRLFNARSKEELQMVQVQTRNAGVLEAIREVKMMSLRKDLKALYEAHMKQVRDRHARDEYVYDEGLAAGETRGKIEGKIESILQILDELGVVLPKQREKINAQQDMKVLNRWLKLAVQSETVDEFFDRVACEEQNIAE